MSILVSMKALRAFIPALLMIYAVSSAQAEEKGGAAAPPNTVHIDNFAFTPAEITVSPGTTITWVNRDDIPHTIAASNKAFRSKVMDTEQQFSFTFTSPGTYEYFCSLHPHMKGIVTVK